MRQGDGADLLGANDPRSSEIGVIYVAPNDDRQSVLAAILTQDKLGRKQVAVILPEHNKAFQRPVDFEGLKNMRRGLKTQIVFVAPPGPGPAEFARQRRFPVYSSPESFVQSLRDESPSTGQIRRGLFGRRLKPANANGTGSTSGAADVESGPTAPLPNAPLSIAVPVTEERVTPPSGTVNQVEDNQHDQQQHEPESVNGAAIGAAGLGLAAGTGIAAVAAHNGAAASPHPDDEVDLLPPVSGEPQPTNSVSPANAPAQDEVETKPLNSSQASGGPAIIVFPSPQNRAKTTGKLPATVAPVPPAQANTPPAALPKKRRSTGKNAAIAAGAAGAGAGAALATQAPGTGGTPPPPRGNAGGPGGGGGGSRRRTSRTLLVVLLILLTLLLVAGIAFAAPGGLGRLSNVIPGTSPTAKVAITPVSKDVKDAFVLTAVTGTPSPSKHQVQARQLSYTTPSQSNTVPATGQGQIPATFATGTLTFYNALTYSQTVGIGTVLRGADGIQVENTQLAVIPAANPPTEGSVTVSARAVQAGVSGNINAFDVNGTCCLSGVTVQNRGAFSGGQNASTYTAVQQSDIDGAAAPLKTSQTKSAQKAFQAEIKSNEKLVNPAQCSTNVISNHKAGDRATSVTVSVTATCSGEVYDQAGAKTLAAGLLKAEAQKNLGSNYMLLNNNVVTNITAASIIDKQGTVSLNVSAEGIWVYQFSDATKQNLAKLIAGKSEAEAKTLLLQQPGVSDVQITLSSGNTLPTDPANITIVINTVPGLPSGTPTTTPPIPTGTTPATQTPPTPTPTPTSEPGLGGS
ncbi:MAG TPA: hypothetical protein VKV20_05125 [Ktedonobacteraceae bacterium]|jgi:hypothetical protein|nr:hypothetical protein [Ktedonobacteraceae bacterium]